MRLNKQDNNKGHNTRRRRTGSIITIFFIFYQQHVMKLPVFISSQVTRDMARKTILHGRENRAKITRD